MSTAQERLRLTQLGDEFRRRKELEKTLIELEVGSDKSLQELLDLLKTQPSSDVMEALLVGKTYHESGLVAAIMMDHEIAHEMADLVDTEQGVSFQVGVPIVSEVDGQKRVVEVDFSEATKARLVGIVGFRRPLVQLVDTQVIDCIVAVDGDRADKNPVYKAASLQLFGTLQNVRSRMHFHPDYVAPNPRPIEQMFPRQK